MLIDVRTYEVKAGTLKAHLDLYAEYGKGPQSKHLGTPLAYLRPKPATQMSTSTCGCMMMLVTVKPAVRLCGRTQIGWHIPSAAQN